MSQKPSKKSDRSWAALLQEAVAETAKQPRGEGWLTIQQLRAEWACGSNKSYRIINSLLAAGKIERFDGNELRNGKLSRATWYRPVVAR